ncbi:MULTISPECIES: hypothetical protein [unclassified Streptomyces]|uniref:hypothetical protein n=1 Tax=unclassified Streptomyces TaxID=2593676 RepID=UPI0037145DFA
MGFLLGDQVGRLEALLQESGAGAEKFPAIGTCRAVTAVARPVRACGGTPRSM